MVSISTDSNPSPIGDSQKVEQQRSDLSSIEYLVEAELVKLATCLQTYNVPEYTDAVLLENAEQHARRAIELAGPTGQCPTSFLFKVKLAISELYTNFDIPELVPYYLDECLAVLNTEQIELSLVEMAYFTTKAQNSLLFLDRHQEVVETSTALISKHSHELPFGILVALYVNLAHAQHCLENGDSVDTLRTISDILETDSRETEPNEKSFAWLSLSQCFIRHNLWLEAGNCATKGLELTSSEIAEEYLHLTASLLHAYTIASLNNKTELVTIENFLSEHSGNIKSYLVAECWYKLAVGYANRREPVRFNLCIDRGLASIENLEDNYSIFFHANLLAQRAGYLFHLQQYEQAEKLQAEACLLHKKAGIISQVDMNREEIQLINLNLELKRYEDACRVAMKMYNSNLQANIGVLELTPVAIAWSDTMRYSAQYAGAIELLKNTRKKLLEALPQNIGDIFHIKRTKDFNSDILRMYVGKDNIQRNTDFVKMLKLLLEVSERLEYLLDATNKNPKRIFCLAWQNLQLKLLLIPENDIASRANAKMDFVHVCVNLNKPKLATRYINVAQRDLANCSAEDLESNPFIKELIFIQKINMLLDREDVDFKKVGTHLRQLEKRLPEPDSTNLHVHALFSDVEYCYAYRKYVLFGDTASKMLLIRKAKSALNFHYKWIRRDSSSVMEVHNLLADFAEEFGKTKLANKHRDRAREIRDFLFEANGFSD